MYRMSRFNSNINNCLDESPDFLEWVKKGSYLKISMRLKAFKTPELGKAFLEQKFTSVYHDTSDPNAEELKEIAPAIIFAAKYGNFKIVSLLIKQYNVDVNQDGCVAFDGYIIEGATALWCASGAGHLDIVKTLVEAGVNLNQTTKTSSTPLRAACFDGRLDIVRYLVEHGADPNIANIYKNTCLMIASSRGHYNVSEYLLDQKMDPNRQAQCGATALLFAAESGHESIVRLLLTRGGRQIVNQHGVDPLYMAAEYGRVNVVLFLTDPERCTVDLPKNRAVHGLELLGAHLINDRDGRNMSLGFQMLKKAMTLRETEPVLAKCVCPPIPAYGMRTEAATSSQLDDIQYDMEALEMEALILRERILGEYYIDLTGPIVYQGAVYADQGRFYRSLDLWLYALELKKKRNTAIFRDLLRHSQLLSQMVTMEVALEFSVVLRLLTCALEEMDRELERHELARLYDKEAWTVGLHNLAYLMLLACQVMMSDSQEEEFRRLVYQIVSRDFRLKTRASLLHMAADMDTRVDYFHIMNVIRFPSPLLVKLLLQCGANPQVVDAEGNTPLHIICLAENSAIPLDELHAMIGNLINFGAHPDSANLAGESAYHATTHRDRPGPTVLRFHVGVRRLNCLALEAVLLHRGDVDPDLLSTFPEGLQRLVTLHRPHES